MMTTTNNTVDFRTVARNMMNRCAQAYASGNMTYAECVEECDQDVDVVKGAFFNVIDELGRLTGVTTLRLNISRVLEKGCDENTGKKDLFRMAKEIRAIVDQEIKDLETCWLDDSAALLKKAFHEDCLAETFVKTVVWLGGKLWKKLKKLGKAMGINVNEQSVIGGICKGIGGLAHVVLAGAKVVFNVAKYIVSIAGAGIIAIADYVWAGIKWVLSHIKGLWQTLTGKIASLKSNGGDDEYFDDFDDEEDENFTSSAYDED